jgi:hypothetical protein
VAYQDVHNFGRARAYHNVHCVHGILSLGEMLGWFRYGEKGFRQDFDKLNLPAQPPTAYPSILPNVRSQGNARPPAHSHEGDRGSGNWVIRGGKT